MVAILMATYNGARYVGEQIRSIMSQTFKDWLLYVRDDGSTDDTLRIIHELAMADPRIIIMNDHERHRGCAGSFLWLMQNVEADYYMFADQDDVWMPDKIQLTLHTAMSHPDDRPVLVATDLRVVDNQLNTIKESMWRSNMTDRMVDNPANLAISPLYTGCTMLFNKALRDITPRDTGPYQIMHDQCVAYAAQRNNGIITAIHRPTILYRQHGDNTLGFRAVKKNRLYKLLKIKILIHKNIMTYKLASCYMGLSLRQYLALKLPTLKPRI